MLSLHCDDCAKVSQYRSPLVQHVISHHLGIQSCTAICDVRCRELCSKGCVLRHTWSYHMGLGDIMLAWACDVCSGAVWKDKVPLTRHILARHEFPSTEIFVCDICPNTNLSVSAT